MSSAEKSRKSSLVIGRDFRDDAPSPLSALSIICGRARNNVSKCYAAISDCPSANRIYITVWHAEMLAGTWSSWEWCSSTVNGMQITRDNAREGSSCRSRFHQSIPDFTFVGRHAFLGKHEGASQTKSSKKIRGKKCYIYIYIYIWTYYILYIILYNFSY